MAEERDIDLVLVTGAGASREFGVGNNQLPLMGDWAVYLLNKLMQGGPNYQELTGLRPGMSGEEFEIALGQFLRRVISLGLLQPVIEPSTALPNVGNIQPYQLKDWYEQTKHHLERIVDIVRESVFEQFNRDNLNVVRATAAYSRLLQRLQITGESRLVYTTTNYDALGEYALAELGRRPDSGDPSEINASTGPALSVRDLLSGMPRYTPVLHLHGKVGWYRREDGRVISVQTSQHQSGYGIPIVLLPDPEKSYADDDVIMDIWSEFELALRRAKRVLVLGHSLADSFLVRALRENIDPPQRLGITLLADANTGEADRSASPLMPRIAANFGRAGLITIRFGADPDHGDEGLLRWLKDERIPRD